MTLFSTLLTCILTLFFALSAKASPAKKLSSFLCSVVNPSPQFNYADFFSEDFRKQVPKNEMVDFFKQTHEEYGSCLSYRIVKKKSTVYKVVLLTSKKNELLFRLKDSGSKQEAKLTSIFLKGDMAPKYKYRSFSDLKAQLDRLDGNISAVVTNLSDKRTLFSYREQSRHALGSEFKLYILATLIKQINEGKLSWSQKVKIQDSLKSFPSGVLHEEPAGKEVSLYDMASLMIRISDNTATDHLLELAGRKQVEASLTPEINSFPRDNKPFLRTLDLFRTRALLTKSEAKRYSASTPEERLQVIQRLRQVPKKKIGELLGTWKSPKYIEEIEWFGTKRDICNTLNYIKNLSKTGNNAEALSTLSQNTPMVDVDHNSSFDYIGYKGGSEPGVIETSYLLKGTDGDYYCVSMGWNNSHKNVDQGLFLSIVGSAFQLIDTAGL